MEIHFQNESENENDFYHTLKQNKKTIFKMKMKANFKSKFILKTKTKMNFRIEIQF